MGEAPANYTRGATFFQSAGIAVLFVFMPLIASRVTDSVLEVGVIVASFSLAQIASEVYFGRVSDRRGGRLLFIRAGFAASAAAFGLHYLAYDAATLLLARVAAGVATGVMIPSMVAYAYESGGDKRRVASVVSFHALGWLVGIGTAGLTSDTGAIFLAASGFFLAGLASTARLPDLRAERVTGHGAVRGVISRNRFLFLALLLRHIGAASVWTVLPLMIVEELGGEPYHVSVVYVANTVTAFVVMTLMATRIRMGDVAKFKAGIGLTAFVFVGLALVGEWWQAMPFMALVGATWALLYIGGNFHLMAHNPRSTSTGVFSSTLSISTVIGPLAAGAIASAHGYAAVAYFAVAAVAVAFAVSARIPAAPRAG